MKAKTLLHELQASGKYVFHGSGIQVNERFEPRQAYDFVDGQKRPDDLPGVHASPHADIAIFMALIQRRNCPMGSYCSFGLEAGELHFRASQMTLDQLHDPNATPVGYVYVFRQEAFKTRDTIESISYEPIRAECCIQVAVEDLPTDIEVVLTP
jgi:hypothetical protein